MKSVCALLATLALLSVSQASAEEKSPAPKRPNFVVILADDMGYSDLGCYGGEIETPNIDSLADDGLRFRQFYNCSRCTSTRASLLTGYYPQRIGMGEFGRTMDLNVPTVAERLRDAGYRTAMTGKWHLSELPAEPKGEQRLRWMDHQARLDVPFADPASLPTRRGFEKFYGVVWGVVNHFDPFSLVDGETPVEDVPEDYHATDAIARSATFASSRATRSPSSSTPRSRRRIGRSRLGLRRSPSTTASTTAVGMSCGPIDMSVRLSWGCSMRQPSWAPSSTKAKHGINCRPCVASTWRRRWRSTPR